MAAQGSAQLLEEAKTGIKSNPQKSEQTYKQVLESGPGQGETDARNYENALVGLGELYRDQQRTHDLASLIQDTRTIVATFAKAKTAKLGKHDRP